MIINALLGFLIAFVQLLFSWLPDVSISSIYYIGPTLNEALVLISSKWNALMVTFPYAQLGWNVFLYLILPFELLLLTLKFFLGHRAPHNVN